MLFQVKRRTRELTSLFHSYQPYKERKGEEYNVLVTDTSHDGAYFVGHNERYEQVLVPKEEKLMGKIFKVRVVSTSFHMFINWFCFLCAVFVESRAVVSAGFANVARLAS